jgi:hypothetical protein
MDYSSKKVADLKVLCRERKIRGFSKMKRDEVISALQKFDLVPSSENSKPSRSKADAKVNESDDLNIINDSIQNNTDVGKKIKDAFEKSFHKQIQSSRKIKKAGNNSAHYDLEILVDNEWYTVEHKGAKQYKPIDSSKPPWIQGVQFYNGIGSKYALGKRYAREWYDRFIASGHISKKYDVKSEIPSFDDWASKDAFVCGDPKTPFGKELRSKFKGDGKSGGCFDERDELKKNFSISEQDLENIKNEVLSLAQNVLSEKKYWLQIQGNLQGEFYCSWHPELKVSEIKNVKIIDRFSDLVIQFESDVGFNINAMLRWGKGQGLSNLRIDLR